MLKTAPLVVRSSLVLCLLSALWAVPARAADVLLVCDTTGDTVIAAILMADGHTVTTVTNDFATGNAALLADLSRYDAVYWSANGSGAGAAHTVAAVFTNLINYATNGGRLFVTGYDSIASPLDPMLITFVGGTGSFDGGSSGPIVNVDNALTTGVLDIRTAIPTGGSGDQDSLTGLLAGTLAVMPGGSLTGASWTLRTVGFGLVAYVSNGEFGGGVALSWSVATGTTGARAYNAAIRNYAFNASGAGGACIGEDTPCTSPSGRNGICHMDRCCLGCWNGTRCFGGSSGSECGIEGMACISCSDAMPCTLDVCTAAVCSNPIAPTGTACEDGTFCTIGERCDVAGVCAGGGPNSCADTSSCTVDSCDEDANVCVHTPGGGCFIAGVCAMAFTINTANPCQVCDPLRSTTAWSPRTVGIVCGAGSCTTSGGFGTLSGLGMCDATGTCVPAPPMPCASGRCASSSACNAACAIGTCPGGLVCSTASMRCVTPTPTGNRCAASSECMTGFCADGVCCDGPCDQLCDSCNLAGNEGSCLASPVGRSCGISSCSAGTVIDPGACDDAGTCVRPAADPCPSGVCLDSTLCDLNCVPGSCPSGQICTAALRCVTPADNGVVCGAGDECISGACADGLCCQTECGDICESCDQPGRAGLCTPFTASTDPDLECPIGSVCGGGRACTPGMIDAGTPDGGPTPMTDAGPGMSFDGAALIAPPRRGCECGAAGTPAGGSLVGILGLVFVLAARRRRV